MVCFLIGVDGAVVQWIAHSPINSDFVGLTPHLKWDNLYLFAGVHWFSVQNFDLLVCTAVLHPP